jgi:hypothetical protein
MVGVVQVELELTQATNSPINSRPEINSRGGSTDLVNGRNDGSVRQELFLQLLLGKVRDADALDLSRLEQVLHLLPGVFEFPVELDVTTGTIRKGGEIWVVSVWIEGDLVARQVYQIHKSGGRGEGSGVAYRPMDQVEIDIVDTELLQSGIETLLNTLVEGTRDLARDLYRLNSNPHHASCINN